MSQPLMFSEFSSDENLSNNSENNYRKNIKESSIAKKRRTIKRREPFNSDSSSKVQQMKQMLKPDYDDEDDGDNLANFTSEFNPPPNAESASGERIDSRDTTRDFAKQNKESDYDKANIQNSSTNEENDSGVNVEGYNGLSSGYTENYVNQFVPYYQNVANVSNNGNNSEITEKLNYLINLIEEQKDEKIGNVGEELILYTFLGVFVIYIVDSFARVGKYVR